MMESPKICPICHEPCLSNFSTIFQKGTDGVNEVSRLKNENFTLRPGMHVHISCKKNYIRTPELPSSGAKVSYRKARTSSGGFNFRKDRFYCGCVITEREKKTKKSLMSLVRTERLIKDDEWSIEVKGRYACVKTQCTIYSVVQIFRLVNVSKENRYVEEVWKRYNCRQRKNVFRNRWTYRLSLRWTVWYSKSAKNDGRKTER